jgi:hypothetical protein
MAITVLQQKVETLYDSITDSDYDIDSGTIAYELSINPTTRQKNTSVPSDQVGCVDTNGKVYFISKWEHASLSKPTQAQLDAITL